MRILIVGAGATGGYFGGRLLEAGRDVTFLVRPGRAAQLAKMGLLIQSGCGNIDLSAPSTLLASEVRKPFDVVLLSCKSYDLEDAIDAFAPAVGPETAVVSLLNGMRHLDVLDKRLGRDHVLGGHCFISARLDNDGRIIHMSKFHELTFGHRFEEQRPQAKAVSALFGDAGFDAIASDQIMLEMWEKWTFLATFAGITCLMRSAVGDIVAAGGAELTESLLEECRAIAVAAGWSPRPKFMERSRRVLTESGSSLTASMLGDLERGFRTEADQILGDLLRRRSDFAGTDGSLLRIAYTALKAREARVAREQTAMSA